MKLHTKSGVKAFQLTNNIFIHIIPIVIVECQNAPLNVKIGTASKSPLREEEVGHLSSPPTS